MHTVAVDNPSYDIPGEGPIVDQGADYKPEAVPVAISSHPTLEEMQASPGIFTNERGNLKVWKRVFPRSLPGMHRGTIPAARCPIP